MASCEASLPWTEVEVEIPADVVKRVLLNTLPSCVNVPEIDRPNLVLFVFLETARNRMKLSLPEFAALLQPEANNNSKEMRMNL